MLKLVDKSIISLQPDQVVVNEYIPVDGPKPNEDRAYFANQICGVNFGSGCIMPFIKGDNVILTAL